MFGFSHFMEERGQIHKIMYLAHESGEEEKMRQQRLVQCYIKLCCEIKCTEKALQSIEVDTRS